MARIPGVRDLPGVGEVLALLRTQTEALLELPATVTALQRTVRNLADTVNAGRDAVVTVQQLAARLDGLVGDLEQPLRMLVPGLRRAAAVLDDPVVSTIPDTVRLVQAEIAPVLRTLAETQTRIATIASSTDRIMSMVDEAGGMLSALPGAALLGSLAGRFVPPADPAAAKPPIR